MQTFLVQEQVKIILKQCLCFTSLTFSYWLVFRLDSYSCLPTLHHQKIPHMFPSSVSSQESTAGVHPWNEQLSEGCTHLHRNWGLALIPPCLLAPACHRSLPLFWLSKLQEERWFQRKFVLPGFLAPGREFWHCWELGHQHSRGTDLLGLGSAWSRDRDISSQNRIPVELFGNVGIPVMSIWKVLFREGFSFTRVSIQRFIRPGACFGIC